jgi:hypothetical protein
MAAGAGYTALKGGNSKDYGRNMAIGGLLGAGGAAGAGALGTGAAAGSSGSAAAGGASASPIAGAFGGEMFSAPAATGGVPLSGATQFTAQQSASPGLLSSFNEGAKTYAPTMNAAAMGTTIGRNLTPQQQQMQTPQMQQGNGNNTLAQLYQQGQQSYLTPLQQSAAARAQRRQIWGQ